MSDEADMCRNAEEGIERGWKGCVGVNHVVLFSQKSEAPTAGWERTVSGHWQHWWGLRGVGELLSYYIIDHLLSIMAFISINKSTEFSVFVVETEY